MAYYTIINGRRYDRSLIINADFMTRSQGDGRISEKDARKLWRQANDGGRLTEIEEQTLHYLLGSYNWTDKALHFMLDAIAQEQEKLKSYYKIIGGLRFDKKILVEAKKLTEGRGDGRISYEDAQMLWEAVVDSGELKVEENRSIQLVFQQYSWTDKALEWFLARMAEISKEPEEELEDLSVINHILNHQFQVPGLVLEYGEKELQRQLQFRENELAFDEALEMALESIFYNVERRDSFKNLVLNVAGLEFDPDNWEEENTKIREALNGARLSLLPDESNLNEDDREFDLPPDGEQLDNNWIFTLSSSISDHGFWVVVDRKGEKDAYNYGVN